MAQIPNAPDLNRSGRDHFRPIAFSTNQDARAADIKDSPQLHALSEKVGNYIWDNSPDNWLVVPAYNADCAGVWAARACMVVTEKGDVPAVRAFGIALGLVARVVVTAVLDFIQYAVVIVLVGLAFVVGVPLYVLLQLLTKAAEKLCAFCRETHRYFTNYYIKQEMEGLHKQIERLQARISELTAGDGMSALRLDGEELLDEEDFEKAERSVNVDAPDNTPKAAAGAPQLSLTNSPRASAPRKLKPVQTAHYVPPRHSDEATRIFRGFGNVNDGFSMEFNENYGACGANFDRQDIKTDPHGNAITPPNL